MKNNIVYEAWMAKRLGAGHAHTGVVIAITGVACAIAVMMLTWGIARGFDLGIKDKLKGFEPEIKISAPYSYLSGNSGEFVGFSPELQMNIRSTLPEATASLAMLQPAIIKTDDNYEAVIINAFDSNHDRSFEASNIIAGRLPDFSSEDGDTCLVVSTKTASRLGLKVGDRITACFFIHDAIKSRRYTLAGIYRTGFAEFDATVAYGSLHKLQQLNKIDSLTGTTIEINRTGLPIDSLPAAATILQQKIYNDARTQGRIEAELVDNLKNTGAVYLNWLDLISTNVVVIFIIMCIVAGLTMISSLFIIILDRIPTIGLLRAMGASKSAIRNIFILIAMRLVIIGLVIGNVVALGFGALQNSTGIISLDPEMYYIDCVPFSFDPLAIILINVGVIVMSWLMLILPARVASGISPDRTIRFE